MARLTPRITPYIPKPRNISPAHIIRNAPRAIATGNIPHPRIRVPHIAAPRVPASTSSLTKQTHSGVRSPNTMSKPPKTTGTVQAKPAKQTNPKPAPVRAGAVKIPSSIAHQPLGTGPKIPKIGQKKSQIKAGVTKKNPFHFKFPNI